MIFLQLTEQLSSLKSLLLLLNDQQYGQRISYLNNSSIGAHSRHIIELLKCVTNGYDFDTVDYLNRERNLAIENDKSIAVKELNELMDLVRQRDKQMELAVEQDENGYAGFVTTTYYREIVYNTEHTIHHLALIRVALREMNLNIVRDDFGVAYSTIKYLSLQNNN